jgi:hypothetical protein
MILVGYMDGTNMTSMNSLVLLHTHCAEWCVSLGRGHDWLTNEILCVLFCSVDLDRVHTNIKEGAHQGYDTFGEGWIRIDIVPYGTHTITSPLVRAINSTNQIARYTHYHGSASLTHMLNRKRKQIVLLTPSHGGTCRIGEPQGLFPEERYD